MIRHAYESDRNALIALWQCCFSDPQIYIDAYFDRLFIPDHTLVVLKNQSIVAMATIHPATATIDGCDFPCGYVYAVATHPDHRGKGHARQLMKQAVEYAKTKGYCGLITVPANEELFNFYRTLGYQTTAYHERVLFTRSDISRYAGIGLQPCSKSSFLHLRTDFLKTLPATVRLDTTCDTFFYDTVLQFEGQILQIQIPQKLGYVVCFNHEKSVSVKETSLTLDEFREVAPFLISHFQKNSLEATFAFPSADCATPYGMSLWFDDHFQFYMNLMLD